MIPLERKVSTLPSVNIPSQLVGMWKPKTHTNKYSPMHLSSTGISSLYSPPVPYILASNELVWSPFVFERIGGNNNTNIVGVWRELSTLEEMTLRLDLSYQWYVPPDGGVPAETYPGFYKIDSTSNTLQTFENRGTFIENTGQLIFTYFGNTFTYDYVITMPKLILTSVSNGDVIIYEKDD